jgi:hypothetical protein
MKSAIVFGLIGLGALLLLLSGVWTTIFNGKSTWTPEKSARNSEVKSKLYNLAFVVNAPGAPSMQKGQDLGAMKAEYEKLKVESEQLTAEFKSATEGPKTTSSVLKWTGISICGLGLIGWYAANQSR